MNEEFPDRSYYNNNQLLKGCGAKIGYTKEEFEEYIKCKLDPIYFIKNHVKIISLDHGAIPFDLFQYQEDFINAIHKNRKVISMQPRQMGKTQTVAAYILWYTIFNPTVSVAIVANKGATAREILDRYQEMYETVPYFLQSGVKVWNKGNLVLENKSKVFTGATTGGGIRGKTCNLVYVDEVAIVPNTVADAFFTATYPVISSGDTSKVILTSTPLGYNHFWKFWDEAVRGINGFVPIEVKYQQHPRRDQAWANDQLATLGELKFNQEVLCAFLGSSNTLIRADIVAAMPISVPIYKNEDGLMIYEKAIKKDPNLLPDSYQGNRETDGKAHSYVIIVDTAKGTGGDYSAFSVIDISASPYKVVAKYRNNSIAPLLYPSVIHKLARDYNDAWVLFEINASEQVPHIMYYDLEYENMLFVSRGKEGQSISSGFGGKSYALGVTTDKKVKRIGCSNLKALIEEGQLFIPDADTISELSTFVQKKDSWAADDGYHDDMVITLVLFAWLTTQSYFKDLTDIDMRKIIYQSRIDIIEAEALPVGMFTDGTETSQEVLLNF